MGTCPAADFGRADKPPAILACSYCYAPKTPGSLDADRLAGWLRELDEMGVLVWGFGGGEPTLHRRFMEICRETAATTNLAVTFTTHAHPNHADASGPFKREAFTSSV